MNTCQGKQSRCPWQGTGSQKPSQLGGQVRRARKFASLGPGRFHKGKPTCPTDLKRPTARAFRAPSMGRIALQTTLSARTVGRCSTTWTPLQRATVASGSSPSAQVTVWSPSRGGCAATSAPCHGSNSSQPSRRSQRVARAPTGPAAGCRIPRAVSTPARGSVLRCRVVASTGARRRLLRSSALRIRLAQPPANELLARSLGVIHD